MLKVSLIFLPDNVTFLVKKHKVIFEYYLQHSYITNATRMGWSIILVALLRPFNKPLLYEN